MVHEGQLLREIVGGEEVNPRLPVRASQYDGQQLAGLSYFNDIWVRHVSFLA